jgi:hypothetical protein
MWSIKNTTHLKSAATRQVCLLSNSPQKNLKRHPRVLHFSRIYFGGNKENEKIAMTSPVTMSLEDSMTVMFMVPKFNKETLPKPSESQIEFRQEPAKTVAAITLAVGLMIRKSKSIKRN